MNQNVLKKWFLRGTLDNENSISECDFYMVLILLLMQFTEE